jgi:hypothetical protein
MSGSGTISPVSPSDQFSTAGLSDDEKANVRRFCGYPAYGAGPAGFQGWRFFQAYGLLEFRLGADSTTGAPNMAPAELAILRQYLQTLYNLEAAVPGAGANLDTAAAAVWTHNKDEVTDRLALFNTWRRQLCGFLGVPVGPALSEGGNSVGCVV